MKPPAHLRWAGTISCALEADQVRPPLVLGRGLARPKGERPLFPRAGGGSAPSPPMASTRSGAPSPAGLPNRSRASPTASLSGAPPIRGPSPLLLLPHECTATTQASIVPG